MKTLILISSIFVILVGCTPNSETPNKTGDKYVDHKNSEEQERILRCVGKMEVRRVEEAVVKGYRLKTCNIPEGA